MAQPPKPPLQLPSAEWVPINEALERIKQQPGTLLTGDLHQDLKDGRLQAARQYLILRATDRDGTHLYVAYKEEFVSLKELVSPDRSKATIYETVEDARRTVRIKQFAEAVGPSLSFEPLEISELCEKSYWETVPLVERKNEDGKWTCHIYKSHGFERFSEGFFYVRRAEIDLHYPEPRRPHAAERPEAKAPELLPPDRRGRIRVHDWHSISGEIARRCIDPETGRVRVPENESTLVGDVLVWCGEQYGKEPALSEMSEAVRRICGALRSVQK
jgi:hypothetical protein